MKRDRRRGRAFLLAPASLALLASGLVAQDVGYEGPSYTGSSLEPTESKPESKLWFNDGSWWGSLYNAAAQAYHIYRLNLASQAWEDTGVELDDRNGSNADALWDQASGKLYVASHLYTSSGSATSTVANWGRLYRYSYNAGAKTYSLDAGFPVTVTKGRSETRSSPLPRAAPTSRR